MSYPGSNADEQPQSPAPYSLPDAGAANQYPPPDSPAPGAYPQQGGTGYPPQAAGYPQQAGDGYPQQAGDGYPVESHYGVTPLAGNPQTAQLPPVSGPPTSVPPMSGAPMMGPPMSVPPVAGSPMSGPPTMGYPMNPPPAASAQYLSSPPPSAPSGNRGTLTIVLSAVSALLLIAAVVMTVLFVQKNGALTSANQAHASAIADRDKQIKQLQDDLQVKKDELDRSKQDLTGSQNQTAELKKQKDTIRQCLVLLGEANQAEQRGDLTTAKAKDAEAAPICEKAFTYLS